VKIDSRVPVLVGRLDQAAPGDALLFEGQAQQTILPASRFSPQRAHALGCTCCVSRSPSARALTALLHDRARGRIAFFQRVLVVTSSPDGQAEVTAALLRDPVVSACFRPVV